MTSSIPFLFLFLLGFSGIVATRATSFDFQTFTLTGLKFLGDAHLFETSVRLTRDLLVPNTGAGMVLYNKPVRFRCPRNETPASFTSFFSFTIKNLNTGSVGGGLAFVISPNDESIGDAGGYLGIPTGAVAIEFDTLRDDEFKDVSGNHVGLDLNSTVSSKVADLDAINVNLKSGNLVNAWVEYSGENQQLNISISHGKPKPKSPVLSISINLNQHVNEFMFVGFTGSTQGSTEIHSVEWWSFTSCLAKETQKQEQQPKPEPEPEPESQQPLPPPTKNNNLREPPFSMLTGNPRASETKKKTKGCKLCGWVFGVAALLVTAASVTWYIGPINCFNNSFNRYN